jgi:predicted adenylyl cyclase CyaB
VIKDYTEAANIILQLGFEEQKEVSRRRQEIVLGSGTCLYLDKVDGMAGYYAKIESQLDDKEDIKEAREELIKTFEQLGQPKDSLVFDSYAEIA